MRYSSEVGIHAVGRWAVNLVVRLLTKGLRTTLPNQANVEPRFCFFTAGTIAAWIYLFNHDLHNMVGKIAWTRHKVFDQSPMSGNRNGLVLLKPVLSESSKCVEKVKQHERTSPKVNCPYCIGIKYMYRELIKLFCCSLIEPI